jgi:hypothetical protein
MQYHVRCFSFAVLGDSNMLFKALVKLHIAKAQKTQKGNENTALRFHIEIRQTCDDQPQLCKI